MGETYTRREFLKLSADTLQGLAVVDVARKLRLVTGKAEAAREPAEKKGKKDALGEFLGQRVPRAFQVDCLPGMNVLVASGVTSWDSLVSGDKDLLEKIRRMNGVWKSNPKDLIEKGRVLLVPAETGRYTNRQMLASGQYDRLEVRVVGDSSVEEGRRFSPTEIERLNRALVDWVMPYLDKFAPKKATTGMVLIGRAPDNLATNYAREAEHVAVARLDYFTAGRNAFSYYRDEKNEMTSTDTVGSRIYSRRIYLLKEPSSNLREKIMAGNFLTSSEWAGYYLNNMWGMAHELLHLIVTPEYNFPPFDNHSFVRSLSLACVLEFHRGKKKEWDRGPISDGLWLMPEFQVLKVYPDFYKDLFARFREGKAIETISFNESEIFETSEDLFIKKGLGGFREKWDEWKIEYEKITKGMSQKGKELNIDFDRLAKTLDKDREL